MTTFNPDLPTSLSEAAFRVMETVTPSEKVNLSRKYADLWFNGRLSEIGNTAPPAHPGRPDKPELISPHEMPKRSKGKRLGRLAFLHSIAHIELNAIDLGWDIVCRFTAEGLPKAFYDDWVQVALDEAEHFDLLVNRMHELDGLYGDFAAHNGLWEAAVTTREDLLWRLALVPMTLEARGLDTTPEAIRRLRQNNDIESAAILEKIGFEEIAHVAAGVRWFEYLCDKRGIEPMQKYQFLLHNQFKVKLKQPFNVEARNAANMNPEYYKIRDHIRLNGIVKNAQAGT